MSMFKCGKNRRKEVPPRVLWDLVKCAKRNIKQMSKGIYFYPSGSQALPPYSLCKYLYREIGCILGIIEPRQISAENYTPVEEFYWFTDDLVSYEVEAPPSYKGDDLWIDLPGPFTFPYYCGIPKRVRAFR